MTPAKLTREELKLMLFEHLRATTSTQWENIVQLGVERKIGRQLYQPESRALLEMVHELSVSNIIMPAADRSNAGWPWFSLTEHGKRLLASSGPPVYDYDGYLSALRSRIPSIDSVVEYYLAESLRAFHFNLYLASMTMLGAASERAMRLLIESFLQSISDEKNRSKLQARLQGRDIAASYKRFRESFDSIRSSITDDRLPREFDAHVAGVFELIRLARNSIVHPHAVPNITSALTYANLQQFAYFGEAIFGLIAYFKTNPTTV